MLCIATKGAAGEATALLEKILVNLLLAKSVDLCYNNSITTAAYAAERST